MHVGNLYFNRADGGRWPSGSRPARSAAASYFANSGAEANEAALKLVRKARPRGDLVVLHGGFHGRTYGALSATPQETKQAPFAPLVPGFVVVAPTPRRSTRRSGERTAAVLLEPDPGRERREPDRPEVLARGARRVRPHRRRARLRRDPDRHGADGHAVGLRGRGRRARRDDGRQGAGRRPADRRADHRPAARRRVRARRPRLHLRRRPGGRRGRARRARRARRPGAARPRARAGRAPRRSACASCPASLARARPRAHGRRRRSTAPAPDVVRARAARAAARGQRDRPGDAPLPAAARRRRGRAWTTRVGPARARCSPKRRLQMDRPAGPDRPGRATGSLPTGCACCSSRTTTATR